MKQPPLWRLQPGTDLVVIEAMKMRNAVKADREARIDSLLVTKGATVAADAPLVKYQADDPKL
jgi:biotin carboxyl carrier protein